MPNVLQPSLSNTPSYKSITETGAAPYATDLLQRGQAFTKAETPVYEGQLTTGPSQYQNQSWQGLANLALPENSKFSTEQAQQYMNPYIQTALDPQLEYMRRQAQINQQGDMAKLAQAGAFGGSRQAILQGQNQEALMRKQAETTGAGYEKAYNAAMAQFNADQSNQRSNLNALSAAGASEHEIEQAALDAQYKDWLRQTKYPGEQLDQMKGIITAMAPLTPKTETIYGQKEKAVSTAAGVLGGVASALGIKTMDDLIKKAGEYGLTVDNFKKMLGITGELPKELGKDGQSADPGERARTGLEEPTEEDARGGGGGGDSGGGGDATDPILPPEGDENVAEEYGGYGSGYSGAAQGGLVDLLHKMRSHK
jgi:hypothetical protein